MLLRTEHFASIPGGGWRHLLEGGCLDIAQPEVCALGGVSEYMQLLAAMPPQPGGLFPRESMLGFDITDNKFRDDLLTEPLDIQGQVKRSGGYAGIPSGLGLGVEPDSAFLAQYTVD